MLQRSKWALFAVGLFIGAGCAINNTASFAKGHAPEFIGGPADWINSPPLSLKDIVRTHRTPDGKPVHAILVDFWEYTCVNCVRTFPYLKEWNKRYGDKGLLIVGIHTPEFQFAHNRANVAAAVQRFGLTYPILVDSDYKNWTAYDNHYWPRHYLLNGDGVIVHDRSGEGGYRETELQIQALLKKADPSLVLPQPVSLVRDTDQEGAVCYPMTPETYAGYERGTLGNRGGYHSDRPFTYMDIGGYADGIPVARGLWLASGESLRHAGTDPNDYVALKYHALDVHVVIRPEAGAPIRVYVTQDERPVAKADKGDDLRYDEQGRSYLQVDTPRMYDVVKNAKWGTHVLKLSSDSDAFGLYSYTFGSCVAK